ncbi:coiled-coil domain-containing protein 187 [Pyxicephalus adspersus]|uniref:coiled-coil domain-containing protein 187 n=1 Tax=Pyxicephalus adspersus TaxID=30357 RepID=UPI003B5BD5F5
MSEKPGWNTSASPKYSNMQDVFQAWDSFMEAKNVLQRIENKADLQNRRRSQAQRIRRRLEMDRGLYTGPDTLSEDINNSIYHEQEEGFQRISEQTFPLYSSSPDQADPHLSGPNLDRGSLEKYSTCPQNTLEMEFYNNFSGGSTAMESYFADEDVEKILETDKLCPQVPTPESTVQVVNPYLRMACPLSAHGVQDTISKCSSPVAFTLPKSDIYVLKLECLKNRSPGSKLERLKERIREQRRRQETGRKDFTKSQQHPELAPKIMTMQKIRKVTFGPPPPIYKGFSASKKKASLVHPDECVVTREIEKIKKKDHKTQRKAHLQALRFTKGKANCPVSRKLSFKSVSPERKEKNSGYDPYGASAWREGQKLVQQILGPLPIALRKRRVCEKQEILQHENCRNICQKIGCQDNLGEEHLRHKRESSQSPDMLQVLRDIQAGKKMLMSPCRSLREGYEKVSNESVSRNVSPKRPRSKTDSHDNKVFGKENVHVGESGLPNSTKVRSYSVQEVRNFMKRKIIERQKAEKENKSNMHNALQTKQEQLSTILRKQKKAFPKKHASVKISAYKNDISTGACVMTKVDNIRRDLSEWLHSTSDNLLKEEPRGSGKALKKFTEEPFQNGHTSPLQLQDLTATPIIHRRDLQDNIHSEEGLDSDKQSLYRDSQERVQAIWAAAKDLGRRVEVEMTRFGEIPLNSNMTLSSSKSLPPHVRPMLSKISEQTGADNAHETKCSKPTESKHCVLLLKSSNMASAQVASCAKLTKKMKNNQDYKMEKTQPIKSQPKFRTKTTQRSGKAHQTTHKSVQKRSELCSPKIKQGMTGLLDGIKTTSAFVDKKDKSTLLQYGELQPQVSDLRQSEMEITNRIKARLEQQEKDLTVLRLKAEMEAREAERCMQEILQHDSQVLPAELKFVKMHPRDKQQKCYDSLLSKTESAGQRFESAIDVFFESASANTPSAPVINSTLKKPVSILSTENNNSERSWDHTDPVTDSTSKWSEVSHFYGSTDMFTRLTMEMAQQYIREEELRARHHTALLRLRDDALKEKTKAELARLKHQRMYWEMKKEQDKVEEILRQEKNIYKKLKQEQAEIQHLHNIYKAAHQERKLLLKQQIEIMKIQQSTANIQQKLQCSSVQVSQQSDLGVLSNQEVDSTLCNFTLSTKQLHQDTELAVSDLSVDDDITEDTTRIENAKGSPTMHDPDNPHTVPILLKDDQTRCTEEQQIIYCVPTKQDRADESNSLSEKSKPVTGSLQSPLTNLCQEFLRLQEDHSNHSQERSSANDDDLSTCYIEETHIVPEKEKEKGKNMNFQGHEMTKAENTDILYQQQNPNMMSTDRIKGDAKLMSKIRSDGLLKPSESNVKSQTQGTGILLSSFSEFHKVSAKLINISESSVSMSDPKQDGQDTESWDSDVFDMESTGLPTEEMFSVNKEPVAQLFDPNPGQSDENVIIMSAFHKRKQNSCIGISGEDSSHPPFSQNGFLNLRSAESLGMEEIETKKAPLAYESFPTSEDVTESDSKSYRVEHLHVNQDDTTVKVTDLQKLTSMSSENISNVAEISLSDTKDQTRMTEMNVKQSFIENVIFEKIETAPFHATTSNDLFQIKSFPHPSEGEVIFIKDEVLEPIEDTLSEIFSPVDEKLSYGSEDLYSVKQYHSEELPSLPKDIDSIKSDDIDTYDFPTPPEEIVFSGTESFQSSQASLIEEIQLLYDNLLTENALVSTSKPVDELPIDGYLEAPTLEAEDQKKLKNVVNSAPFLTLSKPEDDLHDPLFTFEIGDRVLVKLSKPGTLMYKGLMAFRDGFWAGVVLDKAEGDNDGTYKGLQYFQCPANCGVFVRPGQISQLLFDDRSSSGTPRDDNNASGEGQSSRNFTAQDETGSDRRKGGEGADDKKEQNSESINKTRSCCLKPSETSSDQSYTDACGIYPNGVKTKPLNEDRDPDQASQISLFCAVDTKTIMLCRHEKNTVVKVTDELFKSVLSDVFETFTKISQDKFIKENVKQYMKNKEKRSENYTQDQLQLLTTKSSETAGFLENIAEKIVMDTIKDCVEKYRKIKMKQKETFWPIDISAIPLQVSTS